MMATTLDHATDHAVDPLSEDCPPEPYGCGQPTGSPCVSIAPGRFYGTPKRRPCLSRAKKAGTVFEPTRPDELAGDRLRRSETDAGQRRAQGGRPDYAGHADR